MGKWWTDEDVEYLENSWGTVNFKTIMKKLNRSEDAIKNKVARLGLVAYLASGAYITFYQLMSALGRSSSISYARTSWIKNRGLPVMEKTVINKTCLVIYLKDFWDWAEKNRTFIDFSKVEKNMLGLEPSWVDEQRRIDVRCSVYKKTPWTAQEDNLLKDLLGKYMYGYREISLRLKRTEGAIKRRMITLNIKSRPVKADNHNHWTDKEFRILKEMLSKGHRAETIAEKINRSALSIKAKIEVIMKEAI